MDGDPSRSDQPHDEAVAPEPHAPATPPARSGAGWRTWAAAGAVTALVVGGGIVWAGRGGDEPAERLTVDAEDDATASADDAASSGFGGRGTFGTITGVDGATLTIEATTMGPPGEEAEAGEAETTVVTVTTTDDTTVTETVEGTLADLAVGATVAVTGEETDGAVAATAITDTGGLDTGGGAGGGPGGAGGTPPEGMAEGDEGERPTPPEGSDGEMPTPPEGAEGEMPEGGGFAGGDRTIGEVTAIDGTTLTVTIDDGTEVTVTTTDDTTVSVTREIDVADLAEGDTISVTGETDGDAVTATAIRRGDLGGGMGMPR